MSSWKDYAERINPRHKPKNDFIKVSHSETQVLVKVVATGGDTVVTAVQCSKTDEHFYTVYAGVITDVSGHLVPSQCLWIISEAADMELCPCASQLGGCPTCAY